MYYVYILTNKNNNVLYTGVTNNLERRVFEHKNGIIAGFTKRYNIRKLVYFETADDVYSVISIEKQIKRLSRAKKQALIEKHNPEYKELFIDCC